ncbi:MAG: S-adenosyl-l-methionine hydroxide adenosyltransferase family protein [Candidatus Glassbacteria bacterium]
MQRAIVTLLTDFGESDFFVGAMKGVILSVNQEARIVDISHDIPPQSVREAAFVLKGAYPHFPPGTIHVAVVDPGVGMSRRPILVNAGAHLFVGPDNGIFTWVYKEWPCRVLELTQPQYFLPEVSDTFHGRDVFAPVAGHLSLGVHKIENFGRIIGDPVSIPFPEPILEHGKITGEVIHVDRFGNLVTNIPRMMIRGRVKPDEASIKVSGKVLEGISKSYSQKKEAELLAVIGGSGLLEISVNMGSATKALGARVGEKVTISFP